MEVNVLRCNYPSRNKRTGYLYVRDVYDERRYVLNETFGKFVRCIIEMDSL